MQTFLEWEAPQDSSSKGCQQTARRGHIINCREKENTLYYAAVVWHEYTWPTLLSCENIAFIQIVRTWEVDYTSSLSVNLRLIKAAETSPLKHILTRHSEQNSSFKEFLQLSFSSLNNWIITEMSQKSLKDKACVTLLITIPVNLFDYWLSCQVCGVKRLFCQKYRHKDTRDTKLLTLQNVLHF